MAVTSIYSEILVMVCNEKLKPDQTFRGGKYFVKNYQETIFKHIRKHMKESITYVKLDKESLRLFVYWDGSLATNKDST